MKVVEGRRSVLITSLCLAMLRPSEAVGTSKVKTKVYCEDLAVTLRAKELTLPWFPKEHYIRVGQYQATSLSCKFSVAEKEKSQQERNESLVENPLVEWLFYPEYVNLKKLKEDHIRVQEHGQTSQLTEQPCRFPVSNQMPSLLKDQKLPLCKESLVRGVSVVVNGRQSSLTFHKAIEAHTGTYQCRWMWADGSNCLIFPDSYERVGSGGAEMLHQHGYSHRRSATLFVKAFNDISYLGDLSIVCVANAAIVLVVMILVCLDRRIKSSAMNQMQPRML